MTPVRVNGGDKLPRELVEYAVYYEVPSDKSDREIHYIIKMGNESYGISSVEAYNEATAVVTELFELITDTLGWSYEIGINNFTGITKIEIVLDENTIAATIDDQKYLAAFEAFLKDSVFSTNASKTDYQSLELRCYLASGEVVSILVDPNNPMMWLPPSSYYVYARTRDNDCKKLLDALGLTEWPQEVQNYQYPDDYYETTCERVGAKAPVWDRVMR